MRGGGQKFAHRLSLRIHLIIRGRTHLIFRGVCLTLGGASAWAG